MFYSQRSISSKDKHRLRRMALLRWKENYIKENIYLLQLEGNHAFYFLFKDLDTKLMWDISPLLRGN